MREIRVHAEHLRRREYAAKARGAREASVEVGEEDATKVEEWLTWMAGHTERPDPLLRLPKEAADGLEQKKWW
jgi:hypothetical protein